MYLKKELYELIRTDETIFDFIQESSLDGLWYWDLEDTENEWMNAKFWTVLGYNPEEMPHKSTAWQNIINPDDLKLATENFIQHCKDPNHPYDQIVRYTHKDGSTVWIRCRGLAIRDKDGKPIRMLGAHHDITDIIKSEQALIKAKEIAEVNEERFLLAMNASNDGIFDWNLETNEIYYSPGWKRMLGYEDHELPNDFSVWENNTDPSDVKKSWELQQKLVSKQVDRFVMEFRMKHKDGHRVDILSRAEALFNDNGKAIRIVGTHTDVTQRKRYEAELLASENRYKAAQKLGNVGNWEYDLKTGLFWGSDEAKRIYGFNPEQDNFSTEAVESCIPERDRVHQALIDLIEKGKEYKLEFEIFPVNSAQPRTIISIAELRSDDKGQPISVHGVIQDITARKHAELLLQENNEEIAAQNEELYQTNLELIAAKEKAEESEALYRLIADNTSDSIWVMDADMHFTYTSPSTEKLFGYKLAEWETLDWNMFIIPGYQEAVFNAFSELKSGKQARLNPLSVVARHKNGTELWVEFSANALYDEKQVFTGAVGITRIITERKQAEEALRTSEAKLKALFSSMSEIVVLHELVFDPDGKPVNYRITDCNDAFTRITGIAREDALGRLATELYGTEEPPFLDNYSKVALSGESSHYETYYQPMGKHFSISVVSPEKNHFATVTTDITEHIRAEEALRKSKNTFESVFESANVGKSITLLSGEINVNKAYCDMLGYSKAELRNKKWQELTPEEEIPAIQAFVKPLIEGEKDNARYEKRYICKSGAHIWADVSVSIQRDENSKPLHFITTIVDITKRKQVEQHLMDAKEKSENNERLLKKIAESYPYSFISIIEKDFTVGYSSGQEFTRWNLNPNDFIGLTLEQALGEYAEVAKQHYIKTFAGAETKFELLINNQYVNNQYFAYKTVPLFDEKNEISRILVVAENITERKQAEDALKESESRFKNMFEKHTAIMLLIHPETGKIIGANEASARFYGYSRTELLTMNINKVNILSPEQVTMELENAFNLKRNYFVFQHKLANGEVRIVEVHSSPIHYQDQKILFSIIHDITDRKQAEEALKNRENMLNKIFDVLPIGLWFADENGRLVRGNPAGVKIWGVEPNVSIEEYGVFKARRLDSGKDIKPDDWAWAHTIREGVTIEDEELEIEAFDGKTKIILNYTAPVIDDQGAIQGAIVVNQDITARKHAELLLQENNEEIAAQNEELYQTNLELIAAKEKVEESEAQFRNLFENSADAIFIAETETGFILDANQAAERLTKMDRHEIIGLHQTRLHPPQSVNYSIETFVQHQKLSEEHKTTKPLENIVIRKDGTQIPVEITATKVVYKGKNCLVGNFRDISERKQIELELAESEQRFKALHNASFGGIAIHDNGVILDCNQGLSEMTGYSLDELIGMDGLLLIAPEHRDLVLNNIVSGFEKPYEANGLHKSGKTYPIRLEARNIPYKGKMVRTVEFRDITEGKQAEEALRKSEERFRRLAENAQDLIYRYEYNPKRGFSYVSPAALTITGYTPQEHYADPDLGFKMVHPDDHHLLVAEVNHNEEAIRKPLVIRWIRKDGSLLWTEQRNVPIYNEKGTLIAIEGIAIDITDRKNTEQLLQEKGEEIAVQNEELNQANLELIAAKEKAEASDRLKSAFLANMSHEIRTPMNGILGFAELLKEPNLTGEEQQAYINIIEKSGRRMLNIINQIIDISKIEAGLMEINLKESCINEQLDYIYTFFKPETEAKRIKLTLKNTLPAKESILKTDREKVYAILTNLVKNAIKYTHQGTIELGYETVETSIGPSLRFYVSDTGIGIPKDRQEAIFERFVQADIADTMARQGAGLGLTISKAYVEMLGGRIWVESEEGKGSTFYFTLPYDAGQQLPETRIQGQSSATNNHDVPKLKILVAEDDRVSEMLIDKYIKLFGKEILKVKTGLEAVETCRNNPDIDLILMDIRMPEMGGYEATRQIRVFNKHVVIIAQTAHGLAGDRSKALEAGCNDYIAKPIIKTELLALIQKYFGK